MVKPPLKRNASHDISSGEDTSVAGSCAEARKIDDNIKRVRMQKKNFTILTNYPPNIDKSI